MDGVDETPVIIALAIAILALPILVVVRTIRTERKGRAAAADFQGTTCHVCGANHGSPYTFFEWRFYGVAPIAFYSMLTPHLSVLCPPHARHLSLSYCRSIGRVGYWGFPGFLFGMWYVFRNAWALRATGALTWRHVWACFLFGVVLPWIYLTVFICAFIGLLLVCVHLYE
ncbi:MAG: hypothetical protein JXB13_21570 [Phycisphaerae bacterium]|nr:hypothetical protein [Phycisphaerae bacterium]